MAVNFINEFNRLAGNVIESDMPATPFSGGQSDLTPLRNKAREAIDALLNAQKAAEQGRLDDCLENMRRAKSCIDIALGGPSGPYNAFGSGAALK